MKTVITDLDGTLLNNGKLSDKTIEILKEFQKENRLVLATGRNLESVKNFYKQLDMEVYSNGALILINGLSFYDFKDKEYISNESFSKTIAKRICRICYLLLFRVTIVGKNERVQLNCLYDQIYYILRYLIKHKPMDSIIKNKDLPDNIEKIEACGTIFFNFFFHLLKWFLKSYEVVRVSKYWVEILPKGTNKINQVKYIIDKYHIDLNDLYVFGDGENDIEMLKYCKHSYAPSNALDEVVNTANNQCLSSEQDGVVEVIKSKILN